LDRILNSLKQCGGQSFIILNIRDTEPTSMMLVHTSFS
jgi:hypothetical protein